MPTLRRVSTRSVNPESGRAEAAEWFRRIGIDRVVFGTNYPMHDPVQFVAAIRALPLNDDEREQILWRNAAGILERSKRKRDCR